MVKVGVLALQGDVREHAAALTRAGARPVEVKTQAALGDVDALIVPGGESTTIGKLLDRFGLLVPVKERIDGGMPVYGTCAGAILLAREVAGKHDAPHRLGALDITVERNAYGRQVDSFEADIDVRGLDGSFRAVFIRAPAIRATGPDVEVLAALDGDPVVVRSRRVMASTFHPEMTDDPRLHRLFVDLVEEVA